MHAVVVLCVVKPHPRQGQQTCPTAVPKADCAADAGGKAAGHFGSRQVGPHCSSLLHWGPQQGTRLHWCGTHPIRCHPHCLVQCWFGPVLRHGLCCRSCVTAVLEAAKRSAQPLPLEGSCVTRCLCLEPHIPGLWWGRRMDIWIGLWGLPGNEMRGIVGWLVPGVGVVGSLTIGVPI